MKRLLFFLCLMPFLASAQVQQTFPGKVLFKGPVTFDSIRSAPSLTTDAAGRVVAGPAGLSQQQLLDSIAALNARLVSKQTLADTAQALRNIRTISPDTANVQGPLNVAGRATFSGRADLNGLTYLNGTTTAGGPFISNNTATFNKGAVLKGTTTIDTLSVTQNVFLNNPTLSGATLYSPSLSNASLTAATLANATLSNPTLVGPAISGAVFTNITKFATDVELQGATGLISFRPAAGAEVASISASATGAVSILAANSVTLRGSNLNLQTTTGTDISLASGRNLSVASGVLSISATTYAMNDAGTGNFRFRANNGQPGLYIRGNNGQVIFGAESTTAAATSRVVLESGNLSLRAAGAGVELTAPNGTRWLITVSNAGVISTTQQ